MIQALALATLLETGDLAFKNRKEQPSALAALANYRAAHHASPDDAAAAWRLSMGCYFVGLRFTKDAGKRKELYDEGRKVALGAADRDKNCVPCHFWGSINLALYGDAVGALKMFFALGEIRDHLKQSLALDASYAYGGAYRLLGLIEQKLPGILGGSNDRAREYFERAIEVAPDEPLNYLFLTKLLKEELDDKPMAAITLKRGKALPVPSGERLESLEALAELKSLADL